MNKTELIQNITEKTNVTKREAAAVVDAFLDTVTEALVKGDKIQLVGFGTFEAVTRAERKGRNPLTGKNITIPESKQPKFKAGKALKEAVNK